jgi:hypothetical protein
VETPYSGRYQIRTSPRVEFTSTPLYITYNIITNLTALIMIKIWRFVYRQLLHIKSSQLSPASATAHPQSQLPPPQISCTPQYTTPSSPLFPWNSLPAVYPPRSQIQSSPVYDASASYSHSLSHPTSTWDGEDPDDGYTTTRQAGEVAWDATPAWHRSSCVDYQRRG